jgi:hypothetical protein
MLENLQRWEEMTPEQREKLREEVKDHQEDRRDKHRHSKD